MDPGLLRPLAVGEILDLGIKIYRRRFGTLVRAVAVVVVPVAVLSALVGISLPETSTTDTIDGGEVAAILAGSLLTAVLSFVSSQLATAASFEIVAGDYLDHEPTWQESLRAAFGRLRSLL